MKKIILLLLVAAGGLARAQTNPAVSSNAPPPKTEITSETADFDLNIPKRAVYRGQVVVVDPPKVTLHCEWLLVDLPAAGGHLTNVVAATNVVIDYVDEKNLTNHITSDRAVYFYRQQGAVTNETITFTGHANFPPKVEYPDYTITSEPLVWDRAANGFHFYNDKIIFHQHTNSVSGTNGALLKLF